MPQTNSSVATLTVAPSIKSCPSAIQKYINGGKSNTSSFGLVEKSYTWDKLWLTKSTAPSLVDSNGILLMENRKILNKEEMKLTLDSLYPATNHDFLRQASCKKCVVVGSGGCLRGKNLGPKIDQFPVVIRVNSGPMEGYEKVAGSKTDIRLVYPESTPTTKEYYEGEGLFVVVPYKRDDLLWAASLVNTSLNLTLKTFWRASPMKIDPKVVDPKKVLIINPDIPEMLFKELAHEKRKNGVRATTGTVAILFALHLCESVSVAGFCYNFDSTQNFAYYYGSKKLNQNINVGPHSRSIENLLRAKFLKYNLLTDLTGSMI